MYMLLYIILMEAVVLKTMNQPMDKKSRINIVVGIAMALMLVFCSFSLVRNAADINRLKAQAAEYQMQCEQQLHENEKIKVILHSDNKDDYIEQKAREKGYVKDGEMVFYDISSSK